MKLKMIFKFKIDFLKNFILKMNEQDKLISHQIIYQNNNQHLIAKLFSTWCGICSLFFLLISLFCYIFFISTEKWYMNATTINCIIINNHIKDNNCLVGQNTIPCYNGYIKYNYYVETEGVGGLNTIVKYNKNELMFINKYSKSQLRKELNKYPIGSNQTCWYKISNPNDITLIDKDSINNYNAVITFLILGLIPLIFFIILIIYIKFF